MLLALAVALACARATPTASDIAPLDARDVGIYLPGSLTNPSLFARIFGEPGCGEPGTTACAAALTTWAKVI